MEPSAFEVPSASRGHLTHRLFRYPAKFHPPVADALLRTYSSPGDTVYDPFCGSGTLLVEASALGRASVGSDIDPLAVLVASAKTRRYDLDELSRLVHELEARLSAVARPDSEYEQRQWQDLSDEEFDAQRAGLWIPTIPNIDHWFRRYVQVDLALIRQAIASVQKSEDATRWAELMFASIIRSVSNADPVPVSGLEVTAHMKRKDEAGRVVNPFKAFRAKLRKGLIAVTQYLSEVCPKLDVPEVYQADAGTNSLGRTIDAVITSPPYHSAVDYYRRHQLEMFWLQLTSDHSERLALLPKYIGRARTPQSHPVFASSWAPTALAAQWEETMALTSAGRARDFRAYMLSMRSVFDALSEVLPSGKPAVFVVGRSSWNGDSIPTDQLFVELAHDSFKLTEHKTYTIRNRYMSYSRNNGANINEEHVLVFERKGDS